MNWMLMAVCALLALLVDAAVLLELHDLVNLPRWLVGTDTQAVVTLIKVAGFAWLARQLLLLPNLFKALAWLLAALLLLLLVDQALQWFIQSEASDLFGDVGDEIKRKAGLLLFGLLLATAWLVLANQLFQTDHEQAMRGYARPLGVGAVLIGISMLVYFFDTPKLLGHLLFDTALLGLSLSIGSAKFVLTKGWRRALYVAVVALPGLAYVAPFFFGAGALVYENRERLATVGAESVPVETTDGWQQLLDSKLPDYQPQQRLPLFNDMWLFADGRRLAVRNNGVFEHSGDVENQPDGDGWQLVYQPKDTESIEYIHFDQAGQRGVVGAWYDSVLRTFDGGKSWQPLDTFDIYKKLSGREFGDSLLDDYSAIYLDPVSGAGSFMMGCRYFASADFGQSWTMTRLETADGKGRCVTDSPFAVDLELGLARAAALGSEYLMERTQADEKTFWQPFCAIDFESMLVVKDVPLCDDDDVLSESQRAFLAYDDTMTERVYRQIYDADAIDRIAVAGAIDLDALAATAPMLELALRNSGKQRWFSGAGYLLLVDEAGGIAVDHRVPALSAIFPINGERALGVAHGFVYQTMDHGRVWSALASDLNVLAQPLSAELVYLQQDNQLQRWADGALTTILTLPENGYVHQAITSSDGTRLLMREYDSDAYHYSSDGGSSWDQLVWPQPPMTTDEYGDEVAAELAAFDCNLDAVTAPCAAVFDDGRVLGWPASAADQVSALPDVWMDDDYAWGELAVLGSEPSYLYLPGETSQLHRLEQGKWKKQRLPVVVDEWELKWHSATRSKLALQTGAGELLLIDQSGEHWLFDQSDWSELADTPELIRLCGDQSGTLLVFSNEDGRLAVSDDGGHGWQQSQSSSASGSACGLHGQWLWLFGDGLNIYQQTPSDPLPETSL